MNESRKLAAILAADVVGYSRLTGADEDRTLARLRALRSDLIDPTIAVHNGRVVKRTGDGALVEFRSVVDAVRCAVEVQNAMVERNAGLPPERRIEFRIGIHLGDVVEESDGDLMGDGVNIAARLEGVAAPGAICLSEDAYRQVKARLDLLVSDLGQTQLKNIAEPVRIYSLEVGGAAKAKSAPPVDAVATKSAGQPSALPDKPSIAVLPFTNMSGDPEQEYFVDGMVEDIITALSRFSQLFVIARNSTFTYKGRAVDVRQVAKELNVRYVLEGGVRKSGSRLRITGQLIDATTGAHLWADRFDGGLEDVFDLQDRITASVVGAIAPTLLKAEIERARRKPVENLDPRARAKPGFGIRQLSGGHRAGFRWRSGRCHGADGAGYGSRTAGSQFLHVSDGCRIGPSFQRASRPGRRTGGAFGCPLSRLGLGLLGSDPGICPAGPLARGACCASQISVIGAWDNGFWTPAASAYSESGIIGDGPRRPAQGRSAGMNI